VPITVAPSAAQILFSVDGVTYISDATVVQSISTTADLAAGRLILQMQNGTAPPNTLVSTIVAIRVSGVRVNIAGTSLASLSANMTATGNAFVGGQTSVVVISAITSAISSVNTLANPALPAGPTNLDTAMLTINAVNGATGTVNFNVQEGFLNAWVTGAQLLVTFSALPSGVTLTVPAAITTTQLSRFNISGVSTFPNVPFNIMTATYVLATPGAAADINQEWVTIGVTVNAAAPSTGPIPQGSVTATVDMGPKTGPGVVAVPRYTGTSCQKGPATLLSVITATTNLLMPYATTMAGYDTGIAIANTTSDPFTPTTAKQNGALTFWLFPAGGTPFSVTPATGGGLTSGVLKAGDEYVYLLSTLLSDAGKPTAFSGYIFIICNFGSGHGQYFISDFEAFTNGALMLVVPPGLRPASESLGN